VSAQVIGSGRLRIRSKKMKAVASLVISAALLLTLVPPKALAQTSEQAAAGRQAAVAASATPERDLKARFAAEVANARADTRAAEGAVRLEKVRVRAQQNPKSGFNNKHVVLAVVVVVVIVGLAIVLAHNGVDPKPLCDDEPLTPGCIR
jgi:hypothetical protein